MPLRNLTNLWKSLSSRIRKGAIFVLVIWGILALLAPLLATNQPWIVQLGDKLYFPAFSFTRYYELPSPSGAYLAQDKSVYDWSQANPSFIMYAPIPYSANTSDIDNADYVSPFASQIKMSDGQETPIFLHFRHWLGTNKRGEDVLSGILHGARFSLFLAFTSMLIALCIGLLMGVLAGYYANSNYKISRNAFLLRLFGTLLFFFMFIWQGVERWQIAAEQEILTKVLLPDLLLFFSANLGWYYLVKKLEQRKLLGRRIIQVPYESLVQRLIEIVQALPLTVLLIMLSAVSKSSVWQLVMIMGAVQWISIARLLKVELQSVRNSDYFIALRGLGLRDQQIIFYKALPNFLPMLVTAFMLGFAQCVLAEAGLSFLGIGIPGDTVTWGTLLSAAKENWNAWWLIVFPGLSLASVLIALNGLFKK